MTTDQKVSYWFAIIMLAAIGSELPVQGHMKPVLVVAFVAMIYNIIKSIINDMKGNP